VIALSWIDITRPVIASEAKQSRAAYDVLDCFVASLLAMTTQPQLIIKL